MDGAWWWSSPPPEIHPRSKRISRSGGWRRRSQKMWIGKSLLICCQLVHLRSLHIHRPNLKSLRKIEKINCAVSRPPPHWSSSAAPPPHHILLYYTLARDLSPQSLTQSFLLSLWSNRHQTWWIHYVDILTDRSIYWATAADDRWTSEWGDLICRQKVCRYFLLPSSL